MRIYVETLNNYVLCNQLIIDKGIYLTVVIGQITVYAILLTFYQFIVSFQGNEEYVQKYLGVNLIDYYVNKKLWIYNRIISKPLFGLIFIMEILYKPFITIYGNVISDNIISVLNFIWYAYVISFFVFFVILFFQCTSCILSLRRVADRRRNVDIIRRINKDFRKKSIMEVIKNKAVDMLVDDMKYLSYRIAQDNDSELKEEYSKLVINIFDDYVRKKEKEIELIFKRNIKVKNQIAWIYTMDVECRLLSELMNGKIFQTEHFLDNYIQNLHLRLLLLNLKRAQADGYEEIRVDIWDSNKNSVNCKEWKGLTEEIFEKSLLQGKKRLVELLYCGYCSDDKALKKYCEDNLLGIIRDYTWAAFENKEEKKNFSYVFEGILHDNSFNEFYAIKLCDNMISCNEADIEDLIKLVSEENCTYIFVYLVIYYSIYRFRFDWKYINITILKELVENGKSLKSQFDRIDSMISSSRISRRYTSDMYTALVQNLNERITGKWIKEIYQQKSIDAFYITTIKLCVYEQTYYSYDEEGGLEAKVSFVNELVKHKEVLLYDNVKDMIWRMQYRDFYELNCWPEKLQVTLRSLLLMNIKISDELINDEFKYWHYMGIGQYLLFEWAEKNNVSELKKELIRKAYVASNMPIQDYVEYLYSESCICGVELGYAKKEKMKSLLMGVI